MIGRVCLRSHIVQDNEGKVEMLGGKERREGVICCCLERLVGRREGDVEETGR